MMKSFPYRLPISLIILANVFTACGAGFIVYIVFLNLIGLEATIAIEAIMAVIFIFIAKFQMKMKFIKLYEDRIEIPVGRKTKTFLFKDIASVEEIQPQGFCISITDTSGKSFNIEQQRMELSDYFDLQDALALVAPKAPEHSPEQKKMRKLILALTISILLIATLLVGIDTSFEGQSFRMIAGITFLVIFLSGMTFLVNNIQKFYKANRKIFLNPEIKRRREILSWIIACFLIVTLTTAIYFMMPLHRLDTDSNILIPALCIPPLFYLIVDRSLKLNDFLSKSERGLYLFLFIFLGSMNLIFTIPHIIMTFYTQISTTKEAVLGPYTDSKNRGCFTFKADTLFPPEICPGRYPGATDGLKIKYVENTNASGIKIYGKIQLTSECVEKKSTLDIFSTNDNKTL